MIDGKRFTEGYHDQREAETRRDQVAAMITLDADPRRPAPSPKAPLFKDIVEKALAWYIGTRSLRSATLENHEMFARKHLVPFFGALPVDAEHFERPVIRRFIVRLRGGNGTSRILADSSISVGLPTLSIVLDYAVEEKLLTVNPMRSGASLWRAEKRPERIDPFTPNELGRVTAAAYEVERDFGVLVQIVAQCGLRPGEGLALRRCDLDLETAEIHVCGTLSRSRMGPPKTQDSERTVSLIDHEVVDHATSRSVLARIKSMKIISMDPEQRMFPQGYTAYWARRWKEALAKAGVRYRKPHNLRHSFASILLSRGANLLEVQEAGGWRSATVLLNTYARWIKEAKRGARMRAIRRESAQDR